MDVETDSLITCSFPLMLEALEVFFLKKSLIVLSLRSGAFFDKNSIRSTSVEFFHSLMAVSINLCFKIKLFFLSSHFLLIYFL